MEDKETRENLLGPVSKQIGPNARGIIWLTQELLSYDSPGAYEINYLLDGILAPLLDPHEREDKHANNFFLGESFGRPFFVVHSVVQEPRDFGKILETLELAKTCLDENSQVYLLNASNRVDTAKALDELRKTHEQVDFQAYNSNHF